jgi:MFS family permease
MKDIEKIKEYLKKNKILITLIFILLIVHYLLVSPLISLPSPVYGGDYYYQLGQTQHVKYGGSAFESATINSALPGYFIFYSLIAGNFARIFNLDAVAAEFFFSYIIIIFSAVIMFTLVKKLFKNDLLAAISVLIFVMPDRMPVVKYTNFAYVVMMPLFFLLLYYFINSQSLKNSIFLGIVYGLIGLTHSVAFMSSSLLLGVIFLYYVIKPNINFREKEINFKIIKKSLFPYIIIFTIGILFALLWWYKPIFVYHGQTSAHYTEWNNQDWGSAYQFTFFWQTIKENFLNFSGLRLVLFSVFNLIGVIGLILVKDKKTEDKISRSSFIKFMFISAFIITFHYFITQNLFNFNLIPDYIAYLLFSPMLILLFIFGMNFSSYFIKKINLKKEIYFTLIIILLLITQVSAYNQRKEDKWYQNGLHKLPDYLINLQDYLIKESSVYDVILTTKEIGFAVNALTGRKLLSTRRAQNDPFIEMDPRELAQAIILYGNDTEYKKELIKQYEIRYFYWDYYWIQSEYYFDEEGKITGWFDPLILFYSEEKEEILKENGIKYFIQTTWVDPALKADYYKKFRLIFISPENYYNATHPWKPDLDSFMEEVWNYKQNEEKIARLFKIMV